MWRLKAAREIQHHPCLPALAFALVPPSTIAVAHVLPRWLRCSMIHHVGFDEIPNISERTEPAGSDKSSASLNPWSKCMCHPHWEMTRKTSEIMQWLVCVWRCSLRAFPEIWKRFDENTNLKWRSLCFHSVLALCGLSPLGCRTNGCLGILDGLAVPSLRRHPLHLELRAAMALKKRG